MHQFSLHLIGIWNSMFILMIQFSYVNNVDEQMQSTN
jgi:hypothetical protein